MYPSLMMQTGDKDRSLHILFLAVHGGGLRRPTPASNELDTALTLPSLALFNYRPFDSQGQ